MNVKCPNCRHQFEVTVNVVEKLPDILTQYRESVVRLTRTEPIRQAPPPIDPDRPVAK